VNADQQPSLQRVAAVAHCSRQVVQVSTSQTQPGTGARLQPVGGAQKSLVQALWSSQLSAAPLTHWPAVQLSPAVHALPSSQASVVLVCTQRPVAQASVVQGLSSSQTMGAPAQVPAAHESPVEQVLPSSQGVPSGRVGFEQAPVEGLQVPGA